MSRCALILPQIEIHIFEVWISADIQIRILRIGMCDNTLALAKEGDARRVRCMIQKMMNYLKVDGRVAMTSVISLCDCVVVV